MENAKYLLLAGFALLLLMLNPSTAMAELSLRPSLLLSEEYNDNVFLEDVDTDDDYITRILPSVGLIYNAPRWDWDLNYTLDYRYYAKNTVEDDTTHVLDARTHFELMKNFLYLNVNDEFRRISLDSTRDFTEESLFVNQSDRNILTVNPYFHIRPTRTMIIIAGYIYSDIWFKEDIAFDRQRSVAYAESNIMTSAQTTLKAGYRFTKENSDQALDYFTNEAYAGAEYEYANESKIFFTAGNIWAEFEEEKGGERATHFFWNAGANYSSSKFSTALLTSFDYIDNPDGNPLTDARARFDVDFTAARLTQNFYLNFNEYRDAETDDIDTRRYGGGGISRYELTPRTFGTFEFSVDRYEDELANSEIDRFILAVRLDYSLREDFILSVIDRYIESNNDKFPRDEYNNNRVTVQLRKTF